MNEIREIVTKTVIGKGKKLIRLEESILPVNEPFSILGCWIINHQFETELCGKEVIVKGSFENNIWVSSLYEEAMGYDEFLNYLNSN